MAFCASVAGLLAAAVGQLLLEAFEIGFGLVIEAVWFKFGGLMSDRFLACNSHSNPRFVICSVFVVFS